MKLIIGDIHGCYEELQDLLACAGVGRHDQVIALGDVVNRGPASAAVVELLRNRPDTLCLMGNHERKHSRAARGLTGLSESAEDARRDFGPGYADAIRWFRRLPLWLETPEALLVHASVEPGVDMHDQDERVLTGTERGEELLARRHRRPWWELYDGDRPVIVGHRDFRRDGRPFVHKVRNTERVFGIDTGCVRGGRLTGLVLPEFRFVSVKARPGRRKYRDDKSIGGDDDPGRSGIRKGLRLVDDEKEIKKDGQDSSARATELREAAEQLMRAVRREHRRVVGRLRDRSGFDKLEIRRRRLEFGAAVGDHPLRRLLCLQADGRLSPDTVLQAAPARSSRELLDLLRHTRRK